MKNKQNEAQKTEIKSWDEFVELLAKQTTVIHIDSADKTAGNSEIKIRYVNVRQPETIEVTEKGKQTIYKCPFGFSVHTQITSCNRRIRLNELLKFVEQFSAIDMVTANDYKFVCPDGVGQLSFEKGKFNPSLGQKTMKINISSTNGANLLQKYPTLRDTKSITVSLTEFDIFQNNLLARFNYLIQKIKVNTANPGNTGH